MTETNSSEKNAKNERPTTKIILKIFSCIIIAILLYVIPKSTDTVSHMRWIILYFSLIHIVIYWDWGLAAAKDFKITESKSDLYILNGIFVSSMVILVTNFVMALNLVPAIFILIINVNFIIIGTIIFFFGFITIYTTRYIYLRHSWRGTSSATDGEIKINGPYKLVRHPIYYFTYWMYIGSVIVFCTWWALIATLLVIICYTLLGWREEKNLVDRPEYVEYKERVPRFLIQWVYYIFKRRKTK